MIYDIGIARHKLRKIIDTLKQVVRRIKRGHVTVSRLSTEVKNTETDERLVNDKRHLRERIRNCTPLVSPDDDIIVTKNYTDQLLLLNSGRLAVPRVRAYAGGRSNFFNAPVDGIYYHISFPDYKWSSDYVVLSAGDDSRPCEAMERYYFRMVGDFGTVSMIPGTRWEDCENVNTNVNVPYYGNISVTRGAQASAEYDHWYDYYDGECHYMEADNDCLGVVACGGMSGLDGAAGNGACFNSICHMTDDEILAVYDATVPSTHNGAVWGTMTGINANSADRARVENLVYASRDNLRWYGQRLLIEVPSSEYV